MPSRSRPLLFRAARPAGALALALVSASALAGCVGSPASEEARSRTPAAECPITPSTDSGTLRIGILGDASTNLYARETRLAETCMPEAEVSWSRFATGQDIVQAFASGSIDLGILGSVPTAKALSAPLNLDLKVVQANIVNGQSEALVAKTVSSVSELKGKKIIVPFSSTAHYGLLTALDNAGLDPASDVTITNVSPDKMPSAWASSDVEAAYVWNPTLADIKKGGHVLVTDAEIAAAGSPTFQDTLATSSWAEAHPGLLRTWLELNNALVQQYLDDPDSFAEVLGPATGMDPEETRRQLSELTFIPGDQQVHYLELLADALQNTAEFLVAQNQLPATRGLEAYRNATTPELARDIEPDQNRSDAG